MSTTTSPWNETWYWPVKAPNAATGYACSVGETDNVVQCFQNPQAFCLSLNPNDVDYCCNENCTHYPTLQPDYGGTVPCGDSGEFCSPEASCIDSLCHLKLINATTLATLRRINVPFEPIKNHKTPSSSPSPSPSTNSTNSSSPSPTSTPDSPPQHFSTPLIAGIVAVVVGFILVALAVGGVRVYKRRQKTKVGGGGGGSAGYSTSGPAEMHADNYYGPKPSYTELSGESKPGTPVTPQGYSAPAYGNQVAGNMYEMQGSAPGGGHGQVHELP